jgi:hypothetical protein
MPTDEQLCMVGMPLPGADAVIVTDSSLAQAAMVLAWDGVVVEDMRLFSQRVTVVAKIDQDAHQSRIASGWAPVTDRMSIALWKWPEHQATMPPSAVSLSGVIARGKRWQRVLAAAAGFVGFCSTAIMLEQEHAPNQHCLITAHLDGVAVVRAGVGPQDVVLVQAGRQGPVPTARPSTVSRWVEELVYQRLIEDGVLSASGVG